MEITLELIVFTVLAVFTAVSAVLAVTTKRILRAATYLLFVLFGTAGIYFQLNYSFLGAVQLLIYAGGITVLYVFSILLTSSQGDKAEDLKGYKLFVGPQHWPAWASVSSLRSSTTSCRRTSSTANCRSARSAMR